MKSFIISGCIYNQMQIYILKYIVKSFLKGYKNYRSNIKSLIYLSMENYSRFFPILT